MTYSPSIVVKTLLALAVAGSMAALLAQPAAAQSATSLDCKGCIKSKQVKNGKLKGKDLKDSTVTGSKIAPSAVDGSKIAPDAVDGSKIANDAVGSSEVANESLGATDLLSEPGVEFDNDDNNNISVTTTWAAVRTLEVTAPSSGFVTCIASGVADWDGVNGDRQLLLGWDTVGGTTSPPDNNAVRLDPAGSDPRLGITTMRTFTISAGTQSFFLKASCTLCSDTDMDFGHHASACMFFPTQY